MSNLDLTILGRTVRQPIRKLERFPAPKNTSTVSLTTSEITALCPVTGQPDWYSVHIEYIPNSWCLETKSLKLYLWSFRDEGHFCEQLADQICRDVFEAIEPQQVSVILTSTPRGGITISSEASMGTPREGRIG